MADITSIGAGDAAGFLLSAGIVYEIVAAACSSPQTTELNAGARSKTLMKWVGLGLAQATVFVAGASYLAVLEGKNPKPIIAGGVLAGALMAASYIHANKAGLAEKGDQSTENYT
jgi:uncharacterized membrane protein